MFDTYGIAEGIRDYFKNNIVARMQAINRDTTVRLYQVGWEDPYLLKAYDALLVVPDRYEPNDGDQVLVLPIDIFVAAQGKTIEEVTKREFAILDAVYDMVRSDVTLGGNVFDTEVVSADYYDPRSGQQLTAAARVAIRAELDTLGEF